MLLVCDRIQDKIDYIIWILCNLSAMEIKESKIQYIIEHHTVTPCCHARIYEGDEQEERTLKNLAVYRSDCIETICNRYAESLTSPDLQCILIKLICACDHDAIPYLIGMYPSMQLITIDMLKYACLNGCATMFDYVVEQLSETYNLVEMEGAREIIDAYSVAKQICFLHASDFFDFIYPGIEMIWIRHVHQEIMDQNILRNNDIDKFKDECNVENALHLCLDAIVNEQLERVKYIFDTYPDILGGQKLISVTYLANCSDVELISYILEQQEYHYTNNDIIDLFLMCILKNNYDVLQTLYSYCCDRVDDRFWLIDRANNSESLILTGQRLTCFDVLCAFSSIKLLRLIIDDDKFMKEEIDQLFTRDQYDKLHPVTVDPDILIYFLEVNEDIRTDKECVFKAMECIISHHDLEQQVVNDDELINTVAISHIERCIKEYSNNLITIDRVQQIMAIAIDMNNVGHAKICKLILIMDHLW